MFLEVEGFRLSVIRCYLKSLKDKLKNKHTFIQILYVLMNLSSPLICRTIIAMEMSSLPFSQVIISNEANL